ncbi:MAG: ATP-dependent RNA helicase HrpA [Deltaproteobacteria bacterium]|nr:ATP-dependent RNA helicase HrpA [Deltaproteobacteria bacterium]
MVNKINYPPLPIVELKDKIIAMIKAHDVLIIAGETGSGKTTQLPKMCLEAGLGRKGSIACTQPRRIAAMTVAGRVAEEMGGDGADMVGYKVRFIDHSSRRTKIKFLTDGMLLAETARDRHLRRYEMIIIDEAHERSLNIDFLLGILQRLRSKRRDLKIIISSATLDTEKFSRHFQEAPVINIPGKTYPVEVRYLTSEIAERDSELPISERVAQAVFAIGRRPLGDILVFLPTERDILESAERLNSMMIKGGSNALDAMIMPLFGRMSAKEQSRIFQQQKKIKIVLASNVAETSVTVPGIRYVIDTGLARISSYNPRARTTKLPITPISRASADQRKGRCGRIGPGICIRLYSEEDYLARPEYTPPEIIRANLADVILRMVDLHLGHPAKFPFLDPPKSRSIRDGFNLLRELGAIKGNPDEQLQLTKRGRIMARLPLDPMIARMILEAKQRNVLHEVMVIAAVLSIQDPRVRPLGREKLADAAHAKFMAPGSDFLTFLHIWSGYHRTARAVKSRNKLSKYCRQNFLAYQRMREWCDIYGQICKTLDEDGQYDIAAGDVRADAIHQSILSGILRNIARKKEKSYQGAQGQELMIFPGSGQFGKAGQWIVAAELVETSRLYARTVANIKPQWLENLAGSLCRYSYSNPHWSKKTGQVMALEKVSLFGLIIETARPKNYGPINPPEARTIFIQAALVEDQMHNRGFDFLGHNQRLIAKLKDMEDRVRQRHMVDDYQIYHFYDERLPDQVWDAASLRRVIPETGASLFMSEDDILWQETSQEKLAQFPDTMKLNDFRLKLSYKFEPGSKADGVSVHIPAEALPHLEPDLFDWLVPGLFKEKINHILRGLPKSLRKQLVPLNQTVQTIIDRLNFGEGRFYPSLAMVISRHFALDIPLRELSGITLPDHLQMRYCLTAADGRVVKVSRVFTDLLDSGQTPAVSESFKELQEQWKRRKFSLENLADLTTKMPVRDKKGRLSGYAVPALTTVGTDGVGLRLYLSEDEASVHNRAGLLRLYKKAMPRHIKEISQRFALRQTDWPLFAWLGATQQVNAIIYTFILTNTLLNDANPPRSREDFAARVAEFKGGELCSRAGEIFSLLETALTERQRTLETIIDFERKAPTNKINRQRFKEYQTQLSYILPQEFLQEFSAVQLSFTPRYLKALRIRVERANSFPGRDMEKAGILTVFEGRLKEAGEQLLKIKIPRQHAEAARILAEYQMLLAEFRVSLFAQELKTAVPVSVKRLEKKEQELMELL